MKEALKEMSEKGAESNRSVTSINHFAWQSQLRFEKDDAEGSDEMYISVK